MNSAILNEFTAAAYRLHGMLQVEIEREGDNLSQSRNSTLFSIQISVKRDQLES